MDHAAGNCDNTCSAGTLGANKLYYPAGRNVEVPVDKIKYLGCLFEGERSIFFGE